jgi:hypothetical protein
MTMSFLLVIRKYFPQALVAGLCLFATVRTGQAIGQTKYVEEARTAGAFPIVAAKTAANIYVDSQDWIGVVRAAGDLQSDINKVTGVSASMVHDDKSLGANAIIIGTIGKSPLIDQLIRDKRIDVTGVTGKWEAFDIQVVARPLPGVASALVIAGSDKRGTIYGIYDISEEIGVSPWYFWADVPVNHKDNLFVKAGRYMEGASAVKYRGIFFNDEAPALDGWVKEKFGTWPNPEKLTKGATGVANMNHEFYSKVFELVLRLKGNFMWPAMWNNAFNEDDPLNAKTADDYGVVMGTSHHEPMLRAQKEWTRHGTGVWDYSKNADVLKNFWTEGVKRNKDFESMTTIGMRGDGDMPMGGPNLDENVKLLEQIVADQRKILAENVNPDVTKVPQAWALYKEVQSYYEKGMRVPDDVTLLWCDDNWGDIRRLPTPDERKRAGGAGIYYHFDYVGGPRNYKWIDTNPIPKVWEQMNLALQYGADRIWVVNVGDLKPIEFPTEYFLALGRDPKRWTKEKTGEFTKLWAEREFGAAHAAEIADLVSTTLKYNGRRKPELLDPTTFSLVDYQEADRVVADFHTLVTKAEKLQALLPEAVRPAFFELVLHPAKSYAQVAELYIAAGKNKLYGTQGRASANDFAAQTKALFQADADLGDYYNHTLLNGKWDHMMDQTHIGYTMWQQPNRNIMPAVKEIELPEAAAMGVAIEGSTSAWPGATGDAALPGFNIFNQEKHYIDIFDKGKAPFDFTAVASAPWIVLSATKGKVEKEERIWVSVDWSKAPKETSEGSVKIARAGGEDVTVKLHASNPQAVTRTSLKGFVETNGYVSIEAEHYAKKTDAGSVRWEKIDDYGRTLSGMSVFPVTAPSMTPPKDSPCLEYQMYLFSTGKAEVDTIMGPTLNFVPGRGLRFAIAFDDQAPQIVDAIGPLAGRDNLPRDWETIVKDSARHVKTSLDVTSPGYHTLKIWMVDPAVVLQKVVVNMGGLKPSYLGPPESYHASVTK